MTKRGCLHRIKPASVPQSSLSGQLDAQPPPESGARLSCLVIQLAETGAPSLDPVLDRLVRGQQDGQHEVGGVTGGGQHALPLAGLVNRALVALVRHVNLVHEVRLEPDGGQGLVQNLGQLLSQDAPEGITQTVTE